MAGSQIRVHAATAEEGKSESGRDREGGKAKRQSVCRVTHWVSTRGEGDGLHVMVGNYLWRKQGQGDEREGKTRGESMWVTWCTWEVRWKHVDGRDKCGPITEGSALFSKPSSIIGNAGYAGAGTTERNILTLANNRWRRINKDLGRPACPGGFFFLNGCMCTAYFTSPHCGLMYTNWAEQSHRLPNGRKKHRFRSREDL